MLAQRDDRCVVGRVRLASHAHPSGADDIKDKLPPTDTRKRPDQLAFEDNDLEKAEQGKDKLETKQRGACASSLAASPKADTLATPERRAEWDKGGGGDDKPPHYFKENGELDYSYVDGDKSYFKRREESKWPDFNPFDAAQ